MKRRRLLGGIAGLTATTSVVTGTGAFSSVDAQRRLQVAVADDNDALLALRQRGGGKRSLEDGTPETVELYLPGVDERLADADIGLGPDSVYEFDHDASESQKSTPTDGLLRITNQGTQTVDVYSRFETNSQLEVELYDVTDPSDTALRSDPAELGVGESLDVGVRVRTFDAVPNTYDETLTIVAETGTQ